MELAQFQVLKDLPESERGHVLMAIKQKEKSATTAFVLNFFLGQFGAHHFYLGRTAWGLLYLFTFGIFLLGPLLDLFLVWGYTRETNERIALDLISEYKLLSATSDSKAA